MGEKYYKSKDAVMMICIMSGMRSQDSVVWEVIGGEYFGHHHATWTPGA